MRKKKKFDKTIIPDAKYNNSLVSKLIVHLMKQGKKSIAQKAVYDAFEIIEKQSKDKDALEIFDLAIKNTSPIVEVKSRRIGGAHYQVPREVKGDRKTTLAMRWLIKAAKSKKGKPIREKLAEEIMAAARNEGEAVRKKEETHKIAEANKAFAHFAW